MNQKRFLSGLRLIPVSYRARGIRLTLLMLAGSMFDFFSLASFFPLIMIIINPGITQSNSYITSLYTFTHLTSPQQVVIILTVMAFLLILFKTRLNLWITFKKAKYSYDVAAQIADEAMSIHLNRSYINYTSIDFSREMNRISNLPIVFANNFLIPIGTLLTELIIILIIIVAITIYQIDIFFFLILITTPIALVYRWQRKRIGGISAEIKSIYPRLLKYTLQAIEGLVEIRVFSREQYFKKRFNKTFSQLGKTFSHDHLNFTGSIRLTEIVVALCLCSLIIYTQLSGKSYQESLLLLSVYAGASFRAIPSVNRILSALVQIKTHEYSFQELEIILAPSIKVQVNNNKINDHILQHRICLENISFGYDTEVLILNQVQLAINKGEKIIILGKSGAGKSTLFLILLQLIAAKEGIIKVDDIEIGPHNSFLLKRLLGYVPQSPYILDASIIENIAFGIDSENIDNHKIEDILERLDLLEWVKSLPQGSQTIIGEKGAKISGGQRQRIAIGRALYHNAQVLLLDEITNQLDQTTELEIIKLLERLTPEKTIVLITHREELSASFDKVLLLQNKKLIEVSKDKKSQRIIYGE